MNNFGYAYRYLKYDDELEDYMDINNMNIFNCELSKIKIIEE